jgi:hypothetical protein
MFEECVRYCEGLKATERRGPGRKIEAAGWALFFVWVGTSLLLDVGLGIGLLGVGVITLGGQAARNLAGLRLEGFWVVVGLLFLVGGLWELLAVELSLVALLIIGAGLALLVSSLRS